MLRAVLHPDAALIRYGVQALALGVAMYALQATDRGENAFRIHVGALDSAATTQSRHCPQRRKRRASLIGAGLAIVVSVILPDAILYPAVAVILLLVGLAYLRSSLVMTGGHGPFIALEKAFPTTTSSAGPGCASSTPRSGVSLPSSSLT